MEALVWFIVDRIQYATGYFFPISGEQFKPLLLLYQLCELSQSRRLVNHL